MPTTFRTKWPGFSHLSLKNFIFTYFLHVLIKDTQTVDVFQEQMDRIRQAYPKKRLEGRTYNS